jgi:pilus assembly protein Flp/PilA
MKITQITRNQRGQGLVEYLTIVALIAIGATAAVQVLGQDISVQFNQISKFLRNDHSAGRHEPLEERHLRRKNFSNFFQD